MKFPTNLLFLNLNELHFFQIYRDSNLSRWTDFQLSPLLEFFSKAQHIKCSWKLSTSNYWSSFLNLFCRLFPDGGENVSEQRDMPPAPVHPFHPNMEIRRGVLAAECADAMKQFFQLRRKKKKEESPKDPSCLPVTHHPSKLLNKMHDIFHMMFCL